jgi:uncharacterized membrane protein
MNNFDFPFKRNNVIIILAGIATTFIGYLLMIGGGSDDPKVFNESEMFSFRRITLAPLLIVSGFVTVVYGIMVKPKSNGNEKDNSEI